ncbi:uracil-DNA glycosylase [Candidatus Saccharibacteria bacterium]|nr:uracil-DNA glycosylase [Candidatus Saccharibacteria bacterium]
MNSSSLLDQIKADILSKNICPDLAKQATHLVFGTGNSDADIVFIGEAPGKKEDLTGEPFVGAAGKFLDEMLASVNLRRSDIYITNIVKYRPPDNRDPLPKEKEAFLPFLHAQLVAISPKVIVTLGRHSTNCFLPGLQISHIHGRPKLIKVQVDKKEQRWIILPLYHPAAALYNGAMRKVLLEDFVNVPRIISKINNNSLNL